MKQYLQLCQNVLDEGIKSQDRTKVGTISVFGRQTRYSLDGEFPLLTTKQVNFKAIVYELLWFLQGDTNIEYLVKHDCNIWNEWPYQKYQKHKDYQGESLQEFKEKIKTNSLFAKKHGELGPIYGKQWRNFFGKDQILDLIQQIKTNPNSRRLIVSAWNPAQIKEMMLPPCHSFFQFYVRDGYISCQLYQRSADLFLGVPFNIASYATLTYMIGHVTGLKPKEFIHTLGDAHIYLNHLEQVKMQLKRKPYQLPKLKITRKVDSILDFKYEDFELIDYKHYDVIKGKVAI